MKVKVRNVTREIRSVFCGNRKTKVKVTVKVNSNNKDA